MQKKVCEVTFTSTTASCEGVTIIYTVRVRLDQLCIKCLLTHISYVMCYFYTLCNSMVLWWETGRLGPRLLW